MNMNLSIFEIRVIGCLIEKAITTPDQYPLSLNALMNACNQKSNRDPVLDLNEATVHEVVEGLVKKHLVSRIEGNRVTKYKHRFCNSEFGALQLSVQATGILCELFLRGPQTPGELRSRTERLCQFDDVNAVEAELIKLMERDEPLVIKLPREPGKRESRYAHLCSDSSEASASLPTVQKENQTNMSEQERINTLEKQVKDLQQSVDELREKLEQLSGVFIKS